jgi:hypothetical protein
MTFMDRLVRALPVAVVAGVLAGGAVIGVLALVDRPTLAAGLQTATISFVIVFARMMTGRRANALAAAHGNGGSTR